MLANVSKPLLGADFLRANRLLVDLKGGRLVDAESYSSVPLGVSGSAAPQLNAIGQGESDYAFLLANFPALTTPTFSSPTVKHGIVHARARCLAPDKLGNARTEFLAMEVMGLIRRSNGYT